MDKLSPSGLSLVHLNVGSLLANGKIDLLRTQIVGSNIDFFLHLRDMADLCYSRWLDRSPGL